MRENVLEKDSLLRQSLLADSPKFRLQLNSWMGVINYLRLGS